MKHLKNYAKQKLVEKDIEDLAQFNEDLDTMKYKWRERKRKWNSFWNWVFGEDDEDSTSSFSSNNSDDDDESSESSIKKIFKKHKNTLSDVIITWIKVANSYDVNRKKIKQLLDSSDESSDKNFWRTAYALKKQKVKLDECTFILGKVKTKFNDKSYEDLAILISVGYKKVLAIDVIKDYVDIIHWEDITKYIGSSNFKKGLFDNNSVIDIYVHEDFVKKLKSELKFKPTDIAKIYKSTVDSGVTESIDVENLAWKIDKYFGKKTAQYNNFVKLVEKFREQHAISDEDIQEFLTKSKVDLKKFIDFICEDIDTAEQRDYMYLLRKTVQSIIDDKTITL